MRAPRSAWRPGVAAVAALAGLATLTACGSGGGAHWSSPVSVGKGLEAQRVACPDPRYCLVVASGSGDVLQSVYWNGSRWSDPTPGPAASSGKVAMLSCGSPTFCLAMNAANAWAWNGFGWSASMPPPAPPGGPVGPAGPGGGVSAVSCTSERMCMAVTTARTVEVFSAPGGWRSAPSVPAEPVGDKATTPGVDGLVDVSCPEADSCTAVDAGGFAYRWNGKKWADPVAALPPGGQHVACPETRWCMLVDSRGYAAVLSGSKWSGPDFVDPMSMVVSQRSGDRSSVAWGDGDPGTVGLACASRDRCVAVDDAGYALAYDGKEWSPPVRVDDDPHRLSQVSCSTKACMAVDDTKIALSRN